MFIFYDGDKMKEKFEAYPLSWPAGVPRSQEPERSRFKTTFGAARSELLRAISLLGGLDVIISSNIQVMRNGMPYAVYAKLKDTGIAVYFIRRGKPMCFACDRWDDPKDNLWAICKTIEALRGIERWGASDMLDRVFTGFAALPPPPAVKRDWWEVLEIPKYSTVDEIQSAWRKLAQIHHPDLGGDAKKMADINQARDEGLRAR
jgi:hypothetical protein